MKNNLNLPKRDFPETRWSIVVNAADLQSPHRKHALETLFESYLPALRAHLILRRRIEPDRVDDFLQEFFLKKVLEKNLVSKANSERGRFRSFILKSLDNFIRDYYRSHRMEEQLNELESELGSHQSSTAFDVFEIAWARQVFCTAIKKFKKECDDLGYQSRWMLFSQRFLVPVVSGEEADDYEKLAKRCSFESAKKARNEMVGAKRGFDRAIRAVIQDYVLDATYVEAEMQDLFQILKDSGALDQALVEFVPVQNDLSLTEDFFQFVQRTGILEMTGDSNTRRWTDTELARMWDEILDTTFEVIKLGDPRQEIELPLDPQTTRIRDVLYQETPSLKVLDFLRSYAKAKYTESESIEDCPCYFVLYMTAIAAAVYKHQKPLTRLPIPQLKKNIDWVLEFPWIDAKSIEYLEIAKRVV